MVYGTGMSGVCTRHTYVPLCIKPDIYYFYKIPSAPSVTGSKNFAEIQIILGQCMYKERLINGNYKMTAIFFKLLFVMNFLSQALYSGGLQSVTVLVS